MPNTHDLAFNLPFESRSEHPQISRLVSHSIEFQIPSCFCAQMRGLRQKFAREAHF